MIPAAFDYTRAATLDEALDLIAGADPSIRVLAGGQSLIPLMKLRLARPERLIDVGRLPELVGICDLDGGGLAIGALTTWATLLEDARIQHFGALADAIPVIGDIQVRNLGTIGGSLAHADPASDIAAPVLALEVELIARSAARGERSIATNEFFAGPFATVLEPDEMLIEIRLPASAPITASAYRALPQPASGYPIAGVAVVLTAAPGRTADSDGARFSACQVAVTGVGDQPYRAVEIEQAILAGIPLAKALRSITDGQRIASDIHADREYRAAMAVVMARRAADAAIARLTRG
ncbi:MAG: FAD binding domain-containing protein [Candidatus Limnocylindrales bacterium]